MPAYVNIRIPPQRAAALKPSPVNSSNNLGNTGIINPNPMTSMSIVMKIKTRAGVRDWDMRGCFSPKKGAKKQEILLLHALLYSGTLFRLIILAGTAFRVTMQFRCATIPGTAFRVTVPHF